MVIKKNIERAEKLVNPDEQVLFITPTNCTITSSSKRKKKTLPGIAILTNKRFIFEFNALSNTSLETIPVSEINSVNCRGNGMTGGHLEIHTITKTYDILISYKKEIMQKIQNTFEQAKSNTNTNVSQSVFSSADEIVKFKHLLEQGIITQEEFDKKKQQLLGL